MKTWPVNRRTTDNFYSWSEKLTRTFSLLGELKITCFYYIVGSRYFLTISSMCCVEISIVLGNSFPASFLWTLFIYNNFLHCSGFFKIFFNNTITHVYYCLKRWCMPNFERRTARISGCGFQIKSPSNQTTSIRAVLKIAMRIAFIGYQTDEKHNSASFPCRTGKINSKSMRSRSLILHCQFAHSKFPISILPTAPRIMRS